MSYFNTIGLILLFFITILGASSDAVLRTANVGNKVETSKAYYEMQDKILVAKDVELGADNRIIIVPSNKETGIRLNEGNLEFETSIAGLQYSLNGAEKLPVDDNKISLAMAGLSGKTDKITVFNDINEEVLSVFITDFSDLSTRINEKSVKILSAQPDRSMVEIEDKNYEFEINGRKMYREGSWEPAKNILVFTNKEVSSLRAVVEKAITDNKFSENRQQERQVNSIEYFSALNPYSNVKFNKITGSNPVEYTEIADVMYLVVESDTEETLLNKRIVKGKIITGTVDTVNGYIVNQSKLIGSEAVVGLTETEIQALDLASKTGEFILDKYAVTITNEEDFIATVEIK